MESLNELRRSRAKLVEKKRSLVADYAAIAQREAALADGETLPDEDAKRLDGLKDSIRDHEGRIQRLDDRVTTIEGAMAKDADGAGDAATEGGDGRAYTVGARRAVAVQVRKPGSHEDDKTLVIAGAAKMIALGGGNIYSARQAALEVYGESHPVTRALVAGSGPAGGFMVPPDYVAAIIELLRPLTAVRSSGPRGLPMPRGTMPLPRPSQAATARFGAEVQAIPASQQAVDQVVATYKKLTALVPIGNDLLRYSDPSVDAMVRDDLAQVIARREDLAFIRGDGTQGSPKGMLSFCLPGNFITSNASYTLSTAASELGGALNKIETGNVPIVNPVWMMHPRVKNYLLNVQNANGFYVYREEMTTTKTLLGVPFKTTTQIPINLTVGASNDCSEIYMAEMSQAMILDSMTLELAVSREGTYVDALGNTVSVFQADQTLIRGIAEHDFQMRHDEAVAVISGVRWAPAIS